LPHAAALKVAHPLMLRAIAAAKKKNDQQLVHVNSSALKLLHSLVGFGMCWIYGNN
jgi:hypothetical protein